MRPLTDAKPKPLLAVAGRPILDHIVEALPAEITEVVLIVGYKSELIRSYCGEIFLGKKVTYCEQKNFSGGTGDALLCAKAVLKGKFLFMYGDDIHGKTALAKVVKEDHALLAAQSEQPERYGVIYTNDTGTLQKIVEKPTQPDSNLINIGGFVVDEAIFSYDCDISVLGELLVTDFLTAYAQEYPVKVIIQDVWIPIGYPEDIEKAEQILLKR